MKAIQRIRRMKIKNPAKKFEKQAYLGQKVYLDLTFDCLRRNIIRGLWVAL